MPEEKETLRGELFFHSETGTEGGLWAFQDEDFIVSVDDAELPSPDEEAELYLYEGTHILENGDYLKIFDKENPEEVVWEGEISLKQYRPFTENIFEFWIHADENGVPRKIWARWFMDGYPAELTPKKKSGKPN